MADLKNMREQMANIATDARSKLSEITDKTKEARAVEIEAEFDAMMADHDKIEARANREQKIVDAEARAVAVDESKRPVAPAAEARGIDEGHKTEYREAFYSMVSNGGIDGLDGETRSALNLRAQTGGTAAAGGYTVPTELAGFVDKAMAAYGPMYNSDIASVIQTTGGATINIPTVNDTAVTAGAHTEAGTVTDDGGKDATFGQASLGAYAFDTEWVRWSYELAQDSILNVESLLGELLGERLGRKANDKLTTGSGSSDVQGIVTASSLGKTAAAIGAITSDEIIDLVHSVDPAYRGNPKVRFMMHDTTLAAIRKLKDGNGNYLWQMGNFQTGQPSSILGYNVSVNNAMAELGTGNKVAVFGDFGKFYVRKAGAPTMFVARERFAPDYGILGYIRFDSVLANSGAVKHLINA